MSDMFTIEDAENDGLIKDEVMSDYKRVASREAGEIYQYYLEVCEDLGVDPGQDLADLLLRALNDQEFANTLAGVEINLRQARMNDIREEDIEFVERLQNKFKSDESKSSPIEGLVQKKLEQTVSTPVPRLNRNNGDGSSREVERELQELRQEVQRLRSEGSKSPSKTGGGAPSRRSITSDTEREEAVDDLFDDEPEQTEEIQDEEPDEQEVEEFGEDELPPSVTGSTNEPEEDLEGGFGDSDTDEAQTEMSEESWTEEGEQLAEDDDSEEEQDIQVTVPGKEENEEQNIEEEGLEESGFETGGEGEQSDGGSDEGGDKDE